MTESGHNQSVQMLLHVEIKYGDVFILPIKNCLVPFSIQTGK